MNNQDFVGALTSLRISRTHFADFVGVSSVSVSRWATGVQAVPSWIDRLVSLMQVTDVWREWETGPGVVTYPPVSWGPPELGAGYMTVEDWQDAMDRRDMDDADVRDGVVSKPVRNGVVSDLSAGRKEMLEMRAKARAESALKNVQSITSPTAPGAVAVPAPKFLRRG